MPESRHFAGPARVPGGQNPQFGPAVTAPPTIDEQYASVLARGGVSKGLKRRIAFRDKIFNAGDRLQQKLQAKESFGEAFLKDSLGRGREFEDSAESLRARQLAGIDSIGGRQKTLATAASSAVQQGLPAASGGPRGFSKNLNQTLRRGKARQGIINRGDAAIRNQRLKDRLQVAKSSVVRRGQLQQTAADSARLESGLELAQTNANVGVNQAMIGAAGSIAGGITAGFSNNGGSNTPNGGFSQGLSQGTAAADFQIGQGFGDFDINNIGQGVGGGTVYA